MDRINICWQAGKETGQWTPGPDSVQQAAQALYTVTQPSLIPPLYSQTPWLRDMKPPIQRHTAMK